MRSARAAALLLASACSLAPRYERPAAPVPAQIPAGAAAAPAPAGPPAADLGWRDVFGDERLKALVALALANNRDLRVAALNVELTAAQYRIQRASQLPQITATGTYAYEHLPADQSLSGKPVTLNVTTVGVALTSFELDFFGRVRNLSKAALEQYLATEEGRRSAQIALVAQTATQYLATRALDDQVVLAERTLGTLESSLGLTRRTYEAGRTSELDFRTAEAQVEAARFNLSAARQQRALAEDALVLLVGQPLPADLPPPTPLDAQELLAELPGGVPSEVLLRRPDIVAAEHALVGANASVGAARAAFFPSISLTGAVGSSTFGLNGGAPSLELSGLFHGGTGFWSFVPSISLPIFQGGATKANLDVAHVRKSIQVAQYEKAIQGAFREVSDALVSRVALEQQLAIQLARVKSEQRRYELSELRYQKGVDSYLVLLTAQRDLYAAQQLLIQARQARLANLVDLYRALGGGWQERTAPAAAGRDAPAPSTQGS